MARVLCAVDGSPAGREAVDAAISYCREHGAELTFVGLVKPSFLDPPQPSYGELVRRRSAVHHELARAAAAAREAGLTPEIVVRSGRPVKELLAQADATMADEVFLARERNPILAALTGRPRVTVTRITVTGAPRARVEYELRKAA